MRNDQQALADIYSRIITESSGRKVIRGDVDLERLHLRELPGWLADVEVEGNFICFHNYLTTLKGCPKSVGENFFCDFNRLTSLQYGPKTVGGDYYCDHNRLITLKGAPKVIEDGFFCENNRLTTLQYGPKTVVGSFFCNNNRLTTLQGAPKSVGFDFWCYGNPGKFTKEDVMAVSDVDGSIFELDDMVL